MAALEAQQRARALSWEQRGCRSPTRRPSLTLEPNADQRPPPPSPGQCCSLPSPWSCLLPHPQKPPLCWTEPPASRPPCLPVPSPRPPAHRPPPLRIPQTILQIPGQPDRGSFQEILFLESRLTFGLGQAPRLHCFVLSCFLLLFSKNSGARMSWGPSSPLGWVGFLVGKGTAWRWWWRWGRGEVGERRGQAERHQPSLAEEACRGVPGVCPGSHRARAEPAGPQHSAAAAALCSWCFLGGLRGGPQYSARMLPGSTIC